LPMPEPLVLTHWANSGAPSSTGGRRVSLGAQKHRRKRKTAYVTEVQGGIGKLFQPSPRTRTLMATGVYKPGPNLPLSRWTITTNGDIVLQDAHECRYTGYVAKSTVPVIAHREHPNEQGKVVYADWIKAFLDKDHGEFWELMNFTTGKTGLEVSKKEGIDQGTKETDILVKTWPNYPGKGVLYFQDREFDILLTDEFQFKLLLDSIQQWISQFLMAVKPPVTEWTPLGFANVKFNANAASKVIEKGKPGPYVEYCDKYRMKMSFPSLTNKIPNMAYYYFWLQMLSQAIQWIIHIDGYNDDDYLALAWLIVYQANGVGTNERPDEFPLNCDDILSNPR